jgi:hypothetical protein
MTAQPVAPVIPSASRADRRRPGGPRAVRPLPLPSPPDRADVVYGFGRIDASGRVADRMIITALGWRGGAGPDGVSARIHYLGTRLRPFGLLR